MFRDSSSNAWLISSPTLSHGALFACRTCRYDLLEEVDPDYVMFESPNGISIECF